MISVQDFKNYVEFAPNFINDDQLTVICENAKSKLYPSDDNTINCANLISQRPKKVGCDGCCEAADKIKTGSGKCSGTDLSQLEQKECNASQIAMYKYCDNLSGEKCSDDESNLCGSSPSPFATVRERVQDFKSCVNDDDGNCKVDKNSNLIMVLFLLVLVALILGVVSIVKK